MNKNTNEILREPIAKIIGNCFGRYAKYIIQDRALPDIRDGLKPVQRRILFAMHELGLTYDKPYKKSARTVGEVIGKYHPHGDSSIYDAMVRMSQDWKNNLPLIDMHGNNGSIDGDSPAAMRYTECRLSTVASLMLDNIKNDTVDFIYNFDDSEKEPSILPSLFPNLLINGAIGIAAGYATNIPPFNSNEVFQVINYLIDNPEANYNDIFKIMPGPDFPTGATIEGTDGIIDFYKTGRGKLNITSKLGINFDNKNFNQIIITEIPYDTNKSQIIKEINDIIYNETISGIIEVRDETDKNGIRIIVEIKKDKNPEIIKNYLLKNTHLRIVYSVNFVAIVNRKPALLSIIDVLKHYIYYALFIQKQIANYNLKKAKLRHEIVVGLIKALNNISLVIEIIRASDSRENAKQNLIKKFDFTDNQSEAIVNLKLYRLSKTDVKQFLDEITNLERIINELNALINSEELQRIELKNKIFKFQSLYGKPRKTQITTDITNLNFNDVDVVEKELINLSITRSGYIKVVNKRILETNEFDNFGRKNYDLVVFNKLLFTNQKIFLITNLGKTLVIPIYKIKNYKWKDIGEHISSYANISATEKIVYADVIEDDFVNQKVIILTKNGFIKTINLQEILNDKQIKASYCTKLKENDEIIYCSLYNNTLNEKIIILSKFGISYGFDVNEIPVLQKTAVGVKTINLKDNDCLIAACIINDKIHNICLVNSDNLQIIDKNKISINKRVSSGNKIFANYNVKNIFAVKDYMHITILNHDNTINLINANNINKTRERIVIDVMDSSENITYAQILEKNTFK